MLSLHTLASAILSWPHIILTSHRFNHSSCAVSQHQLTMLPSNKPTSSPKVLHQDWSEEGKMDTAGRKLKKNKPDSFWMLSILPSCVQTLWSMSHHSSHLKGQYTHYLQSFSWGRTEAYSAGTTMIQASNFKLVAPTHGFEKLGQSCLNVYSRWCA